MRDAEGHELPRALGFGDLLLLKLVAIINVSLLPPVAGYGRVTLLLWAAAFFLFFVPEAIAVLALAKRFPGEGGIYLWTQRQFGPLHGFISGWCYWIGNLLYFPMQLVYLAGVLAFAGGADTAGLVGQKWFVSVVAFGWLALATGTNVLGLRVGKWVPNVGAVGTALTLALIVGAGASAAVTGRAEAVPFATTHGWELVSSLTVMSFAFMGLELASTMGDEMRNPSRDLPRAALLAGAATLAAYLAVTWSLQALLPASQIGAIQGIVQAVDLGMRRLGLDLLLGPLAVVMAVSIGGGLAAWYAGSTRVPFVAGFDHALPASLGRVHPRWGSPHVALTVQGVLSAACIVVTLAGSTVAEAYQIFLKASAVTTLVPFCYMFLGLARLGDVRWWQQAAGVMGFVVSGAGALAAFVPTSDVGNVVVFELKLVAGALGPMAVGLWLFARSRRPSPAEAAPDRGPRRTRPRVP
jgi:amino acid transporter